VRQIAARVWGRRSVHSSLFREDDVAAAAKLSSGVVKENLDATLRQITAAGGAEPALIESESRTTV
jgi:hypothetical protein